MAAKPRNWIKTEIKGLKQAQQRLGGIAARLQDPRPAFEAMAASIVRITINHFLGEMGPDGTWPDFAVFREGTWSYEMYQVNPKHAWFKRPSGTYVSRSSKLLQDTGTLRNSIQMLRNTMQEVAVGTMLIYAGTHQYGNPDKKIPARPYLWLADEDIIRLSEILLRYVTRSAVSEGA